VPDQFASPQSDPDPASATYPRCQARARAPHRLARYARDVATDFHQFYMACRVLVDDEELRVARLALAHATKVVLGTALGLAGVSAPEAMERVSPS